jgi:hypothetical protein
MCGGAGSVSGETVEGATVGSGAGPDPSRVFGAVEERVLASAAVPCTAELPRQAGATRCGRPRGWVGANRGWCTRVTVSGLCDVVTGGTEAGVADAAPAAAGDPPTPGARKTNARHPCAATCCAVATDTTPTKTAATANMTRLARACRDNGFGHTSTVSDLGRRAATG